MLYAKLRIHFRAFSRFSCWFKFGQNGEFDVSFNGATGKLMKILLSNIRTESSSKINSIDPNTM